MKYSFYNKVVLRTPLRPIKTTYSIDELRLIYSDPRIKEALFLSSPVLYNEMEKWLMAEIKDETRIVNSLLKYAIRFHTRPTPFGLFAGIGVAEWANSYKINEKDSKRYTRLDMNYVCALAHELSKDAHIRQFLTFYTNNSLYKVGDQHRYVEYVLVNNIKKYQISSVETSSYLEAVFEAAIGGKRIVELVEILVDDEITNEDALEFINDLIESQLLISELEPSVIGIEPFTKLVSTLDKLNEINVDQVLTEKVKLLKEIETGLQNIDFNVTNDIGKYREVISNIEKLGVKFEINYLFQTDLYNNINVQGNLNQSPVDDIQTKLLQTVTALNKLKINPKANNYAWFKEKFIKRYETREVSLLEVMDNEFGIGYGYNDNLTGDKSPLLDGLLFGGSSDNDQFVAWNQHQQFLFEKYLSAKENGEKIVKITNADLKDIVANWDDLPITFSVMFSLITASKDPKIYLNIAGNISGVDLIGRFGQNDPEILSIMKDFAQLESNQINDFVIADIVHLPQSRVGNIIVRPSIRAYEIPYLSTSNLDSEHTLELKDLFVSVRNEKIYIRSKKLNKYIIPRLGNAHNFANKNLPVYHFLCDMQAQQVRNNLCFDWGFLRNKVDFLPRVEIDDVIVFCATWYLKQKDFIKLVEDISKLNSEDSIAFLQIIQDWLSNHSIPNIAYLVEGDNKLLINFNDLLSVKMFCSSIKQKVNIELQEYLHSSGPSFVTDENGKEFTNEFITALVRKNGDYEQKKKITNDEQNTIQRTFILGSEWCYYKFYCGISTADKLLTEALKPILLNLFKKQLIDKWFFIRYTDPDFHIRLRFHLPDKKKLARVISYINSAIEKLQTNNLIYKVQIDTYAREIERYGGGKIIICEDIFYADSLCAVDLIEKSNKEDRWLVGIASVDSFLKDLNFTIDERIDLLYNLKEAFSREFGISKSSKLEIDKKFRRYNNEIYQILCSENNVELSEILGNRTAQIAPILQKLKDSNNSEASTQPYNNIVESVIHMILNRLFRTNARAQETLVYDFLWRYYKSERVRSAKLSF